MSFSTELNSLWNKPTFDRRADRQAAFLLCESERDQFEFEKRRQLLVGTNDKSSGDFADSLAVFAAPKRIGLRSHIRLSAGSVKVV